MIDFSVSPWGRSGVASGRTIIIMWRASSTCPRGSSTASIIATVETRWVALTAITYRAPGLLFARRRMLELCIATHSGDTVALPSLYESR